MVKAISHPEEQRDEGRILGVFDDDAGTPVEGVEVTDLLTGLTALTTTTGTVGLGFLQEGGSLVRIRKVGFGVMTLPIATSPSDTTPITILLKRVVELPAVVTKDSARHYISPALRGFEERRKIGPGYFLDETMLRKAGDQPLGNLLMAHVPGVVVKSMRGSAMFLLKSARCSNGGQPDVYLDGVPMAHVPDPRWPQKKGQGAAADADIPIDLSQFSVGTLAAVEFYSDGPTVPIQFNHTAGGCGALFLWTRER